MSSLQDSLVDPGELPDLENSLVLVRRAQDGDGAALGELFVRYQDRLHRIVRVRMGASARRLGESMDVVQETFRVAMRKLPDFEPRDHAGLLDWLARIATRQIHDAVDKVHAAMRDPRREQGLDGMISASVHAAPDTSIGERMFRAELRGILDEVVAELTEDYREVIVLRDYCGADWSRVAEGLGRATIGATKQLHQRAWLRVVALAGPRLRGTHP